MTSACKIQAVWPVAGPPLTSPWPLTFWPWKWCPTHVWRGLLKTVSTNLLSSANWITYCSNIFAIPSSISLMNIRNNKGPNHVCNFLWRSVKWFGRGKGSNFPFSHWLGSWMSLTTLSHYRASVIYFIPVWLNIACLCWKCRLPQTNKRNLWRKLVKCHSSQF